MGNNSENIIMIKERCKKSSASVCIPKSEYTRGRERIAAFILSCPGQQESINGLPCAGRTGAIIDEALKSLKENREGLFPSECRYDYPIINSSDEVRFNAKGNGTEASPAELEKPENIKRLEEEVIESGAQLLILCGNKAQQICNKLPLGKNGKPKERKLKNYAELPNNIITINVCHPSYYNRTYHQEAEKQMAADIDAELKKLGY